MQRKTCDPRVFKSFSFANEFPEGPYHRIRAETGYYKKYNDESQIANLPGGLKRDENEINDNYYKIINQNQVPFTKESQQRKFLMDVHSNVDCLRGMSKIDNSEIKSINPKKYESNNIFSYDKNENTNNSCFNITHKKQYILNNNNNYFNYNNNEENLDEVSVNRIKRKNRNESQFTIN